MTADELVGSKVRELRVGKGMTVESLAEDMGISKAYLSLLEKGKRKWGAELMTAAANALHAQPFTLFLAADPERLAAIEELVEMASGLSPEQIEMIHKLLRTFT